MIYKKINAVENQGFQTADLVELSPRELHTINGGYNFFEGVAYALGALSASYANAAAQGIDISPIY